MAKQKTIGGIYIYGYYENVKLRQFGSSWSRFRTSSPWLSASGSAPERWTRTEYAGISHFIEHMMFKGTTHRSARQIAADIDKIGGQINAFTGKEATCYYVKSISSNYKKAADVICDMLENAALDRQEMNKERQVICEEIKMTLDTPDDLAHDTITSLVFKGTPLGKSIIGTPTSLKRITRGRHGGLSGQTIHQRQHGHLRRGEF